MAGACSANRGWGVWKGTAPSFSRCNASPLAPPQAQVLPATAAAAHRGLQATKRVPQQTTAVMFFGDYTAAW